MYNTSHQEIIQQNRISGVPDDFDWIAYRSLNKDLNWIKTRGDAVKHFKQHGSRQGKPYVFNDVQIEQQYDNNNTVVSTYINRLNGVPNDFDWIAYKSLNRDLCWIASYKDAVKHYKYHGYCQHRKHSFDNIRSCEDPIHENTKIQTGEEVGCNSCVNVELNKESGVPEEFDWHVYCSQNNDLRWIKSYEEAVKHYKEHGYREPRQYTSTHVPTHVPAQIQKDILMEDVLPYQVRVNDHNPPCLNRKEEQIPIDFDWIAYKTINHIDVNSRSDAVRHYLTHGRKLGYNYKAVIVSPLIDSSNMERIQSDYDFITYRPKDRVKPKEPISCDNVKLPKDFNWVAYKLRNPGLSINNFQDAVKHYKLHGYKEDRPYVPDVPDVLTSPQPIDNVPKDFNWIAYKSIHPDLSFLTSEREAIKHYIEHGINEGRKYKVESGKVTKKERKKIPDKKLPPTSRIVKTIITGSVTKPCKTKKNMCQLIKREVFTRDPIIIKTPSPTTGVIPNIIHFVYGFKEQKEPFELFKYIAILSAYYVNKPDTIYFYCKYEPYGDYWNKIKPYVVIVHVEPPEKIFDKKVTRYEHQSDIIRLNKLNDVGGIYLDIDTICLRPLKSLMKYDFVMGIQGDNYGLCNAVMMCKPKTEFGKQWYESYQSFNKTNWDEHSVRIPYRLSSKYPITILPNDAFFYPLWDPFSELILSNHINYDCCHKIFQNSYCLHLWEAWNIGHLKKINEKSIHTDDTLYNIVGRKFIKNKITFILIVYEYDTDVIQIIGTFYGLLNRNDVEKFIIYENHVNNEEILTYLNNLPNINKLFQITHAKNYLNDNEIKDQLTRSVTSGIICYMDHPSYVITPDFCDSFVDMLYDESIGIIGVIGGYLNKNKMTFVKTSNMDVVDHVIGLQIFRSELMYYNIHIDVTSSGDLMTLHEVDFCFQTRNIGKCVMLVSSEKYVNVKKTKQIPVTPDMIASFSEKWKNLSTVMK